MLEREIASVIGFVLEQTDCLQPYYYNVPEGFRVPSVYFPTPEITTEGDTFNSYTMTYVWYIKFFHSTTQGDYAKALQALTACKENRNRIPVIAEDGAVTGAFIRIHDPSLSVSDEGVVQLELRWDSRRPYAVKTEK